VSPLVRHLAAALIVALGCPIALLAGVNLACAQHDTMSPQCADAGLVLSPALLALSGVLCAFLVRGLAGFVTGAVGIVVGMSILWVVMAVNGTPVPFDIAQGVIATIWFGLPSVIGYAIARTAVWTYRKLAIRPT
jgi:hypothetical protein